MKEKSTYTRKQWAVREITWIDYTGTIHTDRAIVTKDDHPQLKRPVPVVSMCLGLPEQAGSPNVWFVGIKSADARLIAAAPELLDALDALLDLHIAEQEGIDPPKPDDWMKAVTHAKAVVAKAKGER